MIRTALALARLGGLVAVWFAVLGGSAFVTSTAILAESGLRSHAPVDRLAGADVVVSAPQTVPQDEDLPAPLPERAVVPAGLVDRLAELPGAARVSGDLSFPAALLAGPAGAVPGDPGTAGHGWSSVALLGADRVTGEPPAGPDEVALGPGARVGDEVRIVAAGTPGSYRVSAALDVPGIYFEDRTAARLAGRDTGPRRDTVDLVGLGAAPGTSPGALAADVRRAVGERYEVATGAARGDAEIPGIAAARQLLLVIAGSLAGIMLLIVGFVVGGALSVSINRQRRELALVRAAGATPRQVRRIIAIQVGLTTMVATVPGVALGYWLAGRLRALLVGLGVLPPELSLARSPLPAVTALLLLLLVVRVSAWAAGFRTSRLPATAAVAESRAEPREPSKLRTRTGLLLMAAALPISTVPLLARSQEAAAATASASILAVAGLALAGPWLAQAGGGALLRGLPPRCPAHTWLAVSNLREYAIRFAGAVAALAMVVGLTLSYTLTQTTVLSAAAADVTAGVQAQRSLTAPALGGIPDGLLAEVRALPRVSAATTMTATTVLHPHRENGKRKVDTVPALAVGPDPGAVLDLGVREGSLSELAADTVAVGTAGPGAGKEVGDRVELLLGDGTRVRPRVVAVYSRSLGFGAVVLSRELVTAHTTTGLDTAIQVQLADERASAELAALARAWPGVEVHDAETDPLLAAAPPQVWVNLAVLAVLLGYVLLAAANKLGATMLARRGEFALLRAVGATPRQVRAMVRREAALIGAAAFGTGLALSAVPLALLGSGFLGRPWPAGPPWLLPATAVGVAAVAWFAVELPARRVLR